MVSFVKIDGKLCWGVFEARVTRFSILTKVDSKRVLCFLPNPGRLEELLVPGAEVLLKSVGKNERKTAYDVVGVKCCGGQIVSVDSRLPNKLVYEALKNRELPEFADYTIIKAEPLYEHVRFDFLLSGDADKCLLEVKSCTLVRDGVAMFPDAPTMRGAKHVLELVKAKNDGYRACIFFLVQRIDAHIFRPNYEMDKVFGENLRRAVKSGVEAYAYTSEFSEDKIMLRRKIEVTL